MSKSDSPASTPDNYVQCPNCDFICKKSELVIMQGESKMRRCPSCADEYCEGLGVEYDWIDPLTTMTEQEIQAQIAWQKQIREKGPVKAMIDHFKPSTLIVVNDEAPQDGGDRA